MSDVSVTIDDLEMAFEWVSTDGMGNQAFVSKADGTIFYASEFEPLEETPDDVDDLTRYWEVPQRNELDLGRKLAVRYIATALPNDYETVDGFFRRRGAYARFKDLLDARGHLEHWYQFEAQAAREALLQWATDEGLQVVDTRSKAPLNTPVRRSNTVFTVKVTLLHTKPPVWRRLRLPDDLPLDELHDVLQIAMGWENCHLHEFVATTKVAYGPQDPDGGMSEAADEMDVPLRALLQKVGDKATYEYDFGDGWMHELLLEEVDEGQLDAPICSGGRRAGPPEDVGGPGRFDDFVAAMTKRKGSAYTTWKEWYDGVFDPDDFDVDAVNAALAEAFGR
jgi:hypothetical protein